MALPPGISHERRAEPRRRVNAQGRIWYGQGYALWADCKLHDVSTGGARIELPPAYRLPARIALVHALEPTIFEAILKWQRGGAVGMAFEKRHQLSGPLEPRLSHIQEMWTALYPSG